MSKVVRATQVCTLQVNCFLVTVITSHVCIATLAEPQGQSGVMRRESKLWFLMMTKTMIVGKLGEPFHISQYIRDLV